MPIQEILEGGRELRSGVHGRYCLGCGWGVLVPTDASLCALATAAKFIQLDAPMVNVWRGPRVSSETPRVTQSLRHTTFLSGRGALGLDSGDNWNRPTVP